MSNTTAPGAANGAPAVAAAAAPVNGAAAVANGAESAAAPVGGSSAAANAAGPLGMAQIPLNVQEILSTLNKQRLQAMVLRMQQLKAAGESEQTNQELANLVNILRYFQQFQHLKQQQAQQAAAAAAATQQTAGATDAAAPAPATSTASATPAATTEDSTTAANGTASTDAAANGAAATPAAPEANGASTPTTGGGPAAFTADQLSTLKTQIIAFKLISRNMPLPPNLQGALLNPDKAIDEIRGGLPDLATLGDAGKAVEAGVAAHIAAEANAASKPKVPLADIKRPPSPKDDPNSAVYPYNAYRQPFTYLSRPTMTPEDFTSTKQQRLLVPSLMPAGLDPQTLLAERDRLIAARVQQRIRELEALPATFSQRPTIRGAEAAAIKEEADEEKGEVKAVWETGYEADNAKIKALIELKSLKLLEKQKELRNTLVRGFSAASTLALDRTAFRKFKKQTLRDARMTEQLERKQRVDREKRTRQKHTDYLGTIVAHGRDLQAAHRSAVANAQKIGKMVLKLHGDTEREEQKRIERIAKERLNALKADDEEAYLKLIDTAKDTRITHLIRQTDAYLGSLAEAVQAQQNDDVHADAIAAERSGIAPPTAEELAAQTANQEIGVAVDETMFGAQRQDDPAEDKGKVDYYSVAHRITERVTEQPSILVGGKLKEYQIKGLQWMVSLYNNRLNGILADEMGLGKTIQTISLITFLIEHKRQPGPYLVIVPLSTLTNWVNEFEKWAPSVNVVIFKGPPLARKAISNRIRQGNFQVLLTTYEYIIKDKATLGKIRWTHMIIDEGHRMKNTQSKLTITLMQAYVSRYRLLLTGTPLQNNLPELWALLNFVLPKIFNSVKSFDEWFNTPFANTGAGDGSMQLNEEEALLIIKRLHKVLRPFLLRRLKKDVESELPDKVEKVIKCKMSSLQRKLYQQMKNHKMLLAGDGSDKKAMKNQGIKGLQNAIMQLRKICNHPYVFEQVEMAINPTKQNGPDLYRVSGKFELLDRLLPKLKATGHRVLIFFQMTAIMDIMEDFLRYRQFKYLRLDGSTKPDDRSVLLKDFNAPNSDIFAFILSTRAGGLGLNLQTADTVIIYDSDWNPHQDLQAQDRAHRIGQKMEVRILRLVTEKSVEELILERAQYKLQIDGKVIQAGKFDNSSGNEEREDLLRAMLEADQDEEEDEDGDLNDDELNQLLARGEHEIERFKEMDVQRDKTYAEEWRSRGWKGKIPERLIQESELPALYQQDFDAAANLEDPAEEEPLVRKRAVVHYDDGLTEDQFLRALEDDDVDMGDLVDKKREKADRRKAKAAAQGLDSEMGTPEPSKGKRKKGHANVSETPDGSPAPGGGTAAFNRKRKRAGPSDTPTPDRDDSPARPPTAKRPKNTGGADDYQRERLKEALLKCYKAMENAVDENQLKRCTIFLDLPKKAEYPDYFVIIQRPVSMRQVKRRIDNRTYRVAWKCREDIHLMVQNAKTYNQEGSWVWNHAVALQEVFDAAYAEHVRGKDLPGGDDDVGSGGVGGSGGGGGADAESQAGSHTQDDNDGGYEPAAATARPKIKLSVKRGRPSVPDDE